MIRKHAVILVFVFDIAQSFCDQISSAARFFDLSGYVKYDAYIDSRQIVGSSDNYNLFYPAPKKYDSLGVDVNKHGQTNLVALASRTKLTITGPEINGCSIKGVFEVDINGRGTVLQVSRVRHAFAEIARDWWKVVGGHTWHPFYEPPHVPYPLANNAGQPFETYARHPQIRISFSKNNSTFVCAALEQVDFLSDGPVDENSVYIRNGMVPELHVQFQQKLGDHWFAVGVDFKRIVPRLITDKGFSVVEHVTSIMTGIMIDVRFEKWIFKTRCMYAENGSEIPLIGGYAVRTIDSITDYRTYTPLRSISWWGECTYELTPKIEPALFVGYAHNLGARHTIITDLLDDTGMVINERVFGFATNVQHIARVSPRIRFKIDAIEACLELEYTHAWQGALQADSKVHNAEGVGVARAMVGMYYYF